MSFANISWHWQTLMKTHAHTNITNSQNIELRTTKNSKSNGRKFLMAKAALDIPQTWIVYRWISRTIRVTIPFCYQYEYDRSLETTWRLLLAINYHFQILMSLQGPHNRMKPRHIKYYWLAFRYLRGHTWYEYYIYSMQYMYSAWNF